MMTGGEIAQIITSLATLVASVGAALSSRRNRKKIAAVQTETIEQSTKIDALHKGIVEVQASTNGMKHELVAEVRAGALAQGRKDADDERRRESTGPP